MRRMITGFIIGAIVATAANLLAQDRGRWVYGAGTDSCGAWMQNRAQYAAKTLSHDGDSIYLAARASWILGFVSGAGWDTAGDVMTRQTDNAGILVAVDKTCAEDPTRDIMEATMKVFLDLGKR